jgi:hypothetical protein
VNVALACYPALMAQLPLAKRPDVAARKVILRLVEAALSGADSALAFLEANKKQIRQVTRKVETDPSLSANSTTTSRPAPRRTTKMPTTFSSRFTGS